MKETTRCWISGILWCITSRWGAFVAVGTVVGHSVLYLSNITGRPYYDSNFEAEKQFPFTKSRVQLYYFRITGARTVIYTEWHEIKTPQTTQHTFHTYHQLHSLYHWITNIDQC